jgi:hypothetical protein
MATVAVVSPDGVRHTLQMDQEYLESHGIQITSTRTYNVTAIVVKQRIWEQWQTGMVCFIIQPSIAPT